MPPDSLKSMGMKCLCVHKSLSQQKFPPKAPEAKKPSFDFSLYLHRHFLESLSTCKVIACMGKRRQGKKMLDFSTCLNFHPTSIIWFSWSTEGPKEAGETRLLHLEFTDLDPMRPTHLISFVALYSFPHSSIKYNFLLPYLQIFAGALNAAGIPFLTVSFFFFFSPNISYLHSHVSLFVDHLPV